ncbi:uncharacterized protein IL334_003277 [Kwoniella shivajii]|uniref:FAM86 N-terminal domain-containing protein n=1 Tax=Kwoniella shivajii TaxID=564305 RepID=A0ABZ1CX38_9TREE|nr:hypothetical protein IL334_003277 [Kwoniella shivajii]
MSSSTGDELETLQKQYLSLYPLYLLSIPLPKFLVEMQNQHYLIDELLGERYQPENEYKRKFWRKVLQVMEMGMKEVEEEGEDENENDLEIDERFYDVLTELMIAKGGPSTFDKPASSFRTFIYNMPHSHPFVQPQRQPQRPSTSTRASPENEIGKGKITLVEEQIAIQGGTTGLRTWTAALHLAHHILLHPQSIFQDPTTIDRGIIELGAGTGFLSILLSQLGVNVISTDLGDEAPSDDQDQARETKDEDVEKVETHVQSESITPLARLKSNVSSESQLMCKIKLDDLDEIQVKSLDWTEASLHSPERPEIWDTLENERRTIIAADVIYDPILIPPLVNTINRLIGDSKAECIISATVRNQTTFDGFVNTCKQHNLSVKEIDVPPMDEKNPTFWDSALDKGTQVKILRITRRT